jgi:hypothetical protein
MAGIGHKPHERCALGARVTASWLDHALPSLIIRSGRTLPALSNASRIRRRALALSGCHGGVMSRTMRMIVSICFWLAGRRSWLPFVLWSPFLHPTDSARGECPDLLLAVIDIEALRTSWPDLRQLELVTDETLLRRLGKPSSRGDRAALRGL